MTSQKAKGGPELASRLVSSRLVSSRLVWLSLLPQALACAEPNAESHAERRESRLQADPPETNCFSGVDPPAIEIALQNVAQSDGTIRLGARGSLTFEVGVAAAGRLRVGVGFLSEHGEARWRSDEVVAQGSYEAVVPYDAIDVPQGAANHSGRVAVRATLDPTDGSPRRAGALGLWFHADGDDWLVYDDAALAASFDGGRLTERARSDPQDPPATTAWVRDGDPVQSAAEALAGDHDDEI